MKKLQAYFRTENDAETASISLKQLRVSNVIVDEIPQQSRENIVLVPAANVGSGTAAAGVVPPAAGKNKLTMSKDKNKAFQYILECDVEETDYEAAKEKLEQNDAYMEQKE
ncbi:hypothetical protein [Alteribacter keqinensis]|uniref:Uncharacterized protein n=1 Tax=Alteribacter keqinensis TaxID=2483800 RepID=A0A3M7TQP6_9BACI|nr:hypothetical protein [Alteribacter keqinensis]RNA66670.1 hypothetical protein EBO34_15755 [Alteribacter keqinensis]